MNEEQVIKKAEEINIDDENLDPPFVIVVQGSRESGKTTLIKSLVQHFTRQKINDVKGTITLRTNKNSRITIYECPTDMQAMIDLAKICDLALILIDASIGFEMESFEFLSLLQNHGMPNIMGILTHLDYFRENKAMRKTKKKMKKRFWKEVHDGAKLFYFSGQQKDGLYPKTEVHNLGRFITIQKIKPINWRINHSYVVADRFDTIETQHENQDFNTVSVFGYVRGTYLDKHQRVHVNGLGDFDIMNIQRIDDPCPVELKKTVKQKQAEHEAEKEGLIKKSKKRNLKDKERILYAPYSNVGTLNFEKNSGYINIPDKNVVFTRLEDDQEDQNGEYGGVDLNEKQQLNEGQKMVFGMQDASKNSKFIDDQKIEQPQLLEGILLNDDQIRIKNKISSTEQNFKNILDINIDANEIQKKKNKAFVQNLFREKEVDDLHTFIYGNQDEQQFDDSSDQLLIDTQRFDVNPQRLEIFSQKKMKKLLKKKFVTGQSKDKILMNLLNMSDSDEEGRDKEGNAVDKDQLRRMEENTKKGTKEEKKKKRMLNKGIKVDTDSDENSQDEIDKKQDDDESDNDIKDQKEKKEKKKPVNPDDIVYKPVQKSLEEIKKGLFMGQKFGHFNIGCYVRIEIKVKKQFSRQLLADYPLILCSLKHQETGFAYMRVKIKKHRWYPHILKTKDPLTFSMGWRKFQSIPVFTMETDDEKDKMRMIKYTPKFGFCYGIFYAPVCAVGTTFVGIQKLYDTDDDGNQKDVSHFRLCVTGVVVEINTQFRVMKKLKLIGEPYKIMKNTAFIKGMFNSSLEASKFTGAQLRTVSGIRGSIKKAVKQGAPDGAFRATFEDKILKSDIVFCKTWYQVDIPRFCNPIIAYGRTRLIKTHAELRREKGIALPQKKDSEYLWHDEHVEREREERVFAPLQVPKAITANLPFKQKEKVNDLNELQQKVIEDKRRQNNLLQALNLPVKRPFKKMFMSEEDKKIYSMVQRLSQLDKTYKKEKKQKDGIRAQEKKKRDIKIEEKRQEHNKQNRINRYKKEQGGKNFGGRKSGGKKE